jgi:pimeloyl-ACP methyl ester carboxylesterase
VILETGGHRIDYELRGEAGAPTVVMVHGLTGDRELLAECCDAQWARHGLRRLYFDLPGHGRSTGNPERAGADDLVDAIAALIDCVGAARPLLVGYAYGGYLAQALAARCGATALLLACPVVEPEIARRRLPPKRVARREELVFEGDHERETFEEVAVVQSRAVLAAYRRTVIPSSVAADRGFVAAVRERYAASRPFAAALAARSPTTAIVCGRDDHWVGFEDAARLAALLPGASLRVLADCGHLLPLEEPAELSAAVEEWLHRVRQERT